MKIEEEAEGGSYFNLVRSRHVPLLAKLGIATFAGSTFAGFGAFLYTSLSKQSAQVLALSVTSAVMAALTTVFAIRRRGIVNLLPVEAEKPLLENSLLDVYQEMGRQFDLAVFLDQCMELGPFLLAFTEEEQNECVANMSSKMQHVFKSKGFLSLLPAEAQLALLPAGVPPRLPPMVETPADLRNQQKLMFRMLHTRAMEILQILETNYPTVRYAVVAYGKLMQFVHFLRVQSGNDTQVAIIMSVILVFVLRIVFVLLSLVLRNFFGMFYLPLRLVVV